MADRKSALARVQSVDGAPDLNTKPAAEGFNKPLTLTPAERAQRQPRAAKPPT
jgi:hypothetical protein